MLVMAQVLGPSNLTLDHVRTASHDDPELASLHHALRFGFPPRFKKCKDILKPIYFLQHELSVSGDLVVRPGCQLIVPSSLRTRYLELAHAAHDGVGCTKQLLRGFTWWSGMDEQVTHLVGDCTHCQSSDKV